MATIDYSQYGDVSGIERRRALAKMLESGSAMPMANGGRVVPTYGLGNAAVDIGRILLGNKLAGDASAQEQAMKDAYTQAMKENDAKAYEALNGTPEYKPNNMVELPRPAIAPDVQKAAQLFGNNPQREALANMLIQGQVTKGVNTAKAVDDRETARVAPYDPAKLAGVLPIGNLVNGAEGLTNANISQQIGRALQVGGGVKTIDSGFVKDAATGTVTAAPLTAQQEVEKQSKADQLALDKQKLKYDNQFKKAGLDLDGQRLVFEQMKNKPENQALVATAIENAKNAVAMSAEYHKNASDASLATDMLKDYILVIPKGSDSGFGRMASSVGGFFGKENDIRSADKKLDQLAAALVSFAHKQPGPTSDKDMQSYKDQVGALQDINMTRNDRLHAAESALYYQQRVLAEYGTPDQKVSASAYLKENAEPPVTDKEATKPKDSAW